MRMQLEDEQRQLLRVNIEQILDTEEITHVGADAKIFVCRATVWERKWTFQLKYIIRSHSWRVIGRFS